MIRKLWYFHPTHGYMLRARMHGGNDLVVMALCSEMATTERDRDAWERHKSRLHVNAGSGAIVAEAMQPNDRNPEFRPVDGRTVPAWIRADFAEAILL